MSALGGLTIGVKLDYSQVLRDLGALKVALNNAGKTNVGSDLQKAFNGAADGAKTLESETGKADRTINTVERDARKAERTVGAFGRTMGVTAKSTAGFVTGIGDVNTGLGALLGSVPGIGPALAAPFNLAAKGAETLSTAVEGLVTDSSEGVAGLVTLGVQIAGTAVAVTTLVAVLGPLVAAMAGMVTVTTAFIGAIAGAGAVVFGIIGGFALLTGGLFALDGAFGINGPALTTVKNVLSDVGKTLVSAVSPALQGVAKWLVAFKPQLDAFAKAWGAVFNSAMGPLLNVAGFLLKDILAVVMKLTPMFVSWLNVISANAPTLNGLFGMLTNFATGALVGLVTNGFRMLAWIEGFVQSKVGMQIVSQTFSAIGSTVQFLVGVVGKLVNLFIANWPTISNLVNIVLDAFRQLWPTVQTAAAQFMSIWSQAKNSADFTNGIRILATVVGTELAVAMNAAIYIADGLVKGISALGAAGSWLASTFSSVSGAIGSAFNAIGSSISGTLSGAIDTINRFIDAVKNSPIGSFVNISDIPNPWHGGGSGTGGNVGGVRAFHNGGPVHGFGSGDTVPALLEPGEFVLSKAMLHGLGGAIHGLGGLGGSIASMLGSIGGQCVVFLENLFGVHWPVAYASQMTADVTHSIPSPGDVGVSTIPPYGHVFEYLGNGMVLDSNWVAPLTVGEHPLASIPDIAGYFAPGGNGPSIAAALNPAGIINGLVSKFKGSGLFGGLVNAIIGDIATGEIGKLSDVGSWVGKADNGGGLPEGWSTIYNGTGAVENIQSPSERDATIAELRALREDVKVLHKKLAGTVNVYGAPPKTTAEILNDIEFRVFATQI